MKAFALDIVDQYWLAGCQPEADLCSHGRVRLAIGGTLVEAGTNDFGIGETALALLRTLESGHQVAATPADPLIVHGCGTILMMNCGIGIDWTVRHDADVVCIDEVRHYRAPGGGQAQQTDACCRVPRAHYLSEVLAFALAARRFFEESPKVTHDDADLAQFRAFWREFDERLARQGLSGLRRVTASMAPRPSPASRLAAVVAAVCSRRG